MEEFRKYFLPNATLYKSFADINISEDECDLYYYLMWKHYEFKILTIHHFINYFIMQRELVAHELIKLSMGLNQHKKIEIKYNEVPRLFKEIVKISFQYGPTFMETSMKPLQEEKNNKTDYLEMSNLRLYFRSLQIAFEDTELNDLKLYLAQAGVVWLDSYDQSKFLSANCYIDCSKLMKLIETQNKAMATLRYDMIQIKKRTKEQARHIVQANIIKGVVERMVKKIKVYQDENQMIDEIKLRQMIADMFPELNQQYLDILFDKLEHNTIPSKFLTQRKIYVPEFSQFILSGIIFEEQGNDEDDENEEQLDKITQEKKSEFRSEIDGEKNKYLESKSQQDSKFYLNNQQSNYQAAQPFEKSKQYDYNVPKTAGFVLEEPEIGFKVVRHDKQEIYTKFYQILKEHYVSKRQKQFLNDKDQIIISIQQFKKLLKEKDTGEGVIEIQDFRNVLTKQFSKLMPDDINFIVQDCRENSAIKDYKVAEPVCITDHHEKNIFKDEEKLTNVERRVQKFKSPNTVELSYNWFCVYLQQYLFQIQNIQ